MSKSSLESVEKIQEMANNTDKERLFEMSTSDFKNFTKIFDELQARGWKKIIIDDFDFNFWTI